MHSRERLVAAIRRQEVDRVPANITYYTQDFSQAHFPMREGQDRREAHLEAYTRFGFDPLIGVGGGEARPWRVSDPGRWEVTEESRQTPEGYLQIHYRVQTPAGDLDTVYTQENQLSGWQEEPLVKDEGNLAALAYLPRPHVDVEEVDAAVDRLGDRGLGYIGVNGLWQQACYLRDMAEMAMDPLIRPEWAERYLGIVGGYLAEQAEALCRSKAEAFFINESYLGMGMSPRMFDRFVRPHDERLIQIAKDAGKLVLYHDCGLGRALLERFADMGIDYLETLTPPGAQGDIELEDARRRIGDRVCFRGAFNQQVLETGTPADIEAEVLRCLETMAPGRGYILCPSGPILGSVPMDNLQAFADAAREHCGRYGHA